MVARSRRRRGGFVADVVSGLLLDLDPAFGVTLSGSKVTTWVDRKNSQSFTQATDANRFTYQASGWSNGRPQLVSSSGASTQMSRATGIVHAGNSFTILAVLNQEGNLSFENNTLLVNDVSGLNMVGAHRQEGAKGVGAYDGTAWRIPAPGVLGEQLLVWEIDAGASQIRARRDGAAIGTPQTYDGSWVWTGQVSVCSAHGFLNGKIARILMYQGVLSASALAYVESGLIGMYGL